MTRFRKLPLWGRSLIVSLAALLLVAALAGGWAGYLNLTGNIHEIAPGGVYRSAQLSSGQLRDILREKGIHTVINLRGSDPGDAWYDDEVAVTQQAGAQHISLRMSAIRDPDDALVGALVNILRAAPKPLIIHCNAGADRTGLASALYQLEVTHLPAAEADKQLSFRYGHFPWLTSRTGAMDRAYWRVVENSLN
jgi:protein tyrosine/serine phosphatase